MIRHGKPVTGELLNEGESNKTLIVGDRRGSVRQKLVKLPNNEGRDYIRSIITIAQQPGHYAETASIQHTAVVDVTGGALNGDGLRLCRMGEPEGFDLERAHSLEPAPLPLGALAKLVTRQVIIPAT